MIGVRLAALALGLVVATAGPAPAAPAPGIDESDPWGDVKIFRHPDDLTTRDLRSIDQHRFVVGPGDEAGEVRLTVAIRRIARDFEQVVAVVIDPPRGYQGDYWDSSVLLSPQHPHRSIVQTYEHHEPRTCRHVPTTVLRGQDEVTIDVPATCLPGKRGRVKVWTLVEGYRRPSRTKSNDTLQVPGLHRLGDDAAPPPD